MGNTGADKYEITAGEIHENQFSTFLQQMEDDLWKSDSCGLDSERKKVLASSHGALACTFMDLGVFGSVGTHFPSEKLILPYFSSLSMVAILVCDSHRQAGSSTFISVFLLILLTKKFADKFTRNMITFLHKYY